MTDPSISAILSREQSPCGAFRSLLHWGDRTREDWNCFVTGLVLRHGAPLLSSAAREKALDFLLRCRHVDGAFGFWPSGSQPSIIREQLSSDCDDSAIAAVELARAGRWGRRELRELVCAVLVRRRLARVDGPAPPWLRRGAFLTWLDPHGRNTVVDCCANANVAALLAFAGMTHVPGYAESCEMIEAGLRWSGEDGLRARALTPYYPDPVELRYAVQHAVACGARALETSSYLMSSASWAQATPRPGASVCGSSYGGVFWTAQAIQVARAHGSQCHG